MHSADERPTARTNQAAEERLLAVGGVHALDDGTPCRLKRVDPAAALEDLGWKDALVVRARSVGRGELLCGRRRTPLRVVAPARLKVMLVGEAVPVGDRFYVRAIASDADGRELEIGKWTEVEWRGSGVIRLASDPSAAEFGRCDTCFGTHGFEASAAGTGTIAARLGDVVGTLEVTAK